MKYSVIAHPNSKKPRIELKSGVLHVYIKEPATEGRANSAVILALSKHLKVPKTHFILVKGETSKSKIFEVI